MQYDARDQPLKLPHGKGDHSIATLDGDYYNSTNSFDAPGFFLIIYFSPKHFCIDAYASAVRVLPKLPLRLRHADISILKCVTL